MERRHPPIGGFDTTYARSYSEGFATMMQALEDAGVKTVSFSWTHPDHPVTNPHEEGDFEDPPPGLAVTWCVAVTWWHDHYPAAIGTSEPTANFQRGLVEALADVMRQMGAVIALIDTNGRIDK